MLASELIDETLGLLQSYSQDSEQVATLSADVAADALTFSVSQVRSASLGISPGLVEVDGELMFCSAVGTGANACVIEPWGRGMAGTTAAAHTAGSRIVSQPTFPRSAVLRALNETIGRAFPEMFVPKTVTFTTTVPAITYDLPEDAEWVLEARWQPPLGIAYWVGVKRWRVTNGGSTVVGDPGVAVDIGDRMTPGCPLEVTYAASPALFAAETDNYTTTGLPVSLRDVLVYGAASTLVTSQELSRLQIVSVEQQQRSPLVAPSAALQSSNYLEQRFLRRLKEESASLRRKWPLRLNGSWL